MRQKLTIRIETTPIGKGLLPWVVLHRRGRNTTESQLFALLGYPATEFTKLSPPEQERARSTLELALRYLAAFEYIPRTPEELEPFFERKLITFGERLARPSKALPAIHAGIGIVTQSTLIFATAGDLLALLITPNSIVSLTEGGGDTNLHFGTYRSGTLTSHTYFLMLPKTMGAVFKSDELKQLCGARSSERRLEYLEHIWEKRVVGPEAFRAILLESKPQLNKPNETTAGSIASLLQTESKTEELLSPPLLRPLIRTLQKNFQKVSERIQNGFKTYAARLRQTPLPKPRELPATHLAGGSKKYPLFSGALTRGLDYGKTSLQTRVNRLQQVRLFAIIRNPQLITQSWSALRPDLFAHFNRLSLRSKLLFIAALTMLFASLQGVLWSNRQARIKSTSAAFVGELQNVQTILDTANSTLIYGDEASARAHAEQATQTLAALQARRDRLALESKDRLASLEQGLTELRKRLQHTIDIANPEPVNPELAATLALGNLSPLHALYQKRRYELKPEVNQIFKQEPTKDGFGPPIPWIKDATAVRDGVSLAVDGLIYVGTQSGIVITLRKGEKIEFGLSPIDPALTTLHKIWTDERSDYLYVLDPAEKRLLAFLKKDGALKAQYLSPRFTDLKDFSVDESKKTAYLLDGANVVSIPLSHFGK